MNTILSIAAVRAIRELAKAAFPAFDGSMIEYILQE